MATTTEIPRPAPPEILKQRTVRVGDTLWHEAGEVAAAEGVDLSAVVRHYLAHYVATAPKRQSGGRR